MEDAERSEHLQAGVAENVKDETQAGGQLVAPAEVVGDDLANFGIIGEQRYLFRFGAQAGVHGKTVADRPGILQVEGHAVGRGILDLHAERSAHFIVAVLAQVVHRHRGTRDLIGELAADAQQDHGYGGGLVDVVDQLDVLEAGFPGVLAGQAHEEVGVDVGAVAFVLNAGHFVESAPIVVCPILRLGRRCRPTQPLVSGVIKMIDKSAGRFENGLGVFEEMAAAGRHQQVVADGIVEVARCRPGRQVAAVSGPFGVDIGRAVTFGQRAAPFVVVVDEAGAHAQIFGRLRGQLDLEVDGGVFLVVNGWGRPLSIPEDVAVGIDLDRQERAEEPEFVLDDIAAKVQTAFKTGEAFLAVHIFVVDVLGDCRFVRVEAQHVTRFAAEGAAAIVTHYVAVEFVAARAGDDVDDAAQRTAELGLVARGLDLDFVDEVEGHLHALP